MKKFATIAITVALLGTIANAAFLADAGQVQAKVDLATGAVSLINTSSPGSGDLFISGVSLLSGTDKLLPQNGVDTSGWVDTYIVRLYPVGAGMDAEKAALVAAIGDPTTTDFFGAPDPGQNLDGWAKMSNTPGNLTQANTSFDSANSAFFHPQATWSMGTPLAAGSTADDIRITYSVDGVNGEFEVTNYDFAGGGSNGYKGDGPGNPIMPNEDGSDSILVPESRLENNPGGMTWQHKFTAEGDAATDGRWYDPVPVEAFLFEASEGTFKAVTLPPNGVLAVDDGDGSYWVELPGFPGGTEVAVGGTFNFAAGVDKFWILGIDPNVSSDGTGFPVFLSFNEQAAAFTMTGVPEPATMSLMLFGAIGMIARKRRRS